MMECPFQAEGGATKQRVKGNKSGDLSTTSHTLEKPRNKKKYAHIVEQVRSKTKGLAVGGDVFFGGFRGKKKDDPKTQGGGGEWH